MERRRYRRVTISLPEVVTQKQHRGSSTTLSSPVTNVVGVTVLLGVNRTSRV